MARHETKGTKQLGLALPAELVDAIKAFAAGRGTTVTAEAIMAFRRHMAYPPPDTAPPLPDSPTAPENPLPARAKKKRASSEGG